MTTEPRRVRWLAAASLVALTLLAYAGSFSGPFVLDDAGSIVTNASLRSFATALFPPQELTVSGRPFLNLTLALNHAIGGAQPTGYHAVNLGIHLLAGLTLFALIRRTLARRTTCPTTVAWIVAALWLLHPLATAAVTYVIQRAESLMALLYLATLYTFVRSIESPRGRAWRVGSVICCLLGMATKEVMASAPLIVLLYERAFVSGSLRAAWSARRGYYLALAGTWLLLAILVHGHESRSGTAGLGAPLSSGSYALTQAHALGVYAQLIVWPTPLIFDYGTSVVHDLAAVALPLLGVGVAVVATAVALRRNRAAGFLGAAAFSILAPSSSFIPVATQTMAEHRMYLPLAVAITTVVLGVVQAAGARCLRALAFLTVAGVALTAQRNRTYRDEVTLWSDVATKLASNPRGHVSLAGALLLRGQTTAALSHYERAAALDPGDADMQFRYAEALVTAHRDAEAVAHYRAALQTPGPFPEAHNGLGAALARLGETAAAISQLEAALRLQPSYAEAHAHLGSARLQHGDNTGAIASLETALWLKPYLPEARGNLALALLQANRLADAATHYTRLIEAAPDDIPALNNLGYIALQQGNPAAALSHYEHVARLQPGDPRAHYNVAVARIRLGDPRGAVNELEAALRLKPDYTEATQLLAWVRVRL